MYQRTLACIPTKNRSFTMLAYHASGDSGGDWRSLNWKAGVRKGKPFY